MTAFTFNTGIPASGNNPSVDQPDMLTNNVSTNSILAVDHVTFNSSGTGGAGASGGQHLQVTFNGKNAAGAQTDPISTAFTASGTASSNAYLLYRNASGTFPLSSVRAFGSFAQAAGAVTPDNQYNVSTISGAAVGVTIVNTITLVANATTTNDAVVLITGDTSAQTISYTFAANVLTITARNTIVRLNFAILQA